MAPRFSIVTPVYDPPLWALEECIRSVLAQSSTDWEWCIADDCSPNAKVRERLRKLAASDPRIKVEYRGQNGGIVAASNTALSLATGEFVALLDHDDSLTPDALTVMSEHIDANSIVDYLYSDEDKIDQSGRRFDRFDKPDFAPERLRGQNYLCHFSVIRRALVEEVGGFRDGFDGSQDYDLFLRVVEKARRVIHVPRVLYHWRTVEGSTAVNVNSKPYVFESARKAVEEHCKRTGIRANVSVLPSGFIKCDRRPRTEPLVSIIIPTRGDRKRIWGLDTCLPANAIRSVLEKSTYPNIEIILVHDRVASLDPDIEAFIVDERLSIVWYDKPFDFSDKCNVGFMASRGDVIILLNDDIEIETPEWIEVLISHLEDGDVAMVGPMTRLEDGRIQSAGHGHLGGPHNLSSGQDIDSYGPFGETLISREVSGVTGACVAIPRRVYVDLGGMSLAFPHSYNDVDFALKAADAGYRIIWTPNARLRHFESLTRDPSVRREEYEMLYARWGELVDIDRYTRT
jgi:GT2 family glycosyltransferase